MKPARHPGQHRPRRPGRRGGAGGGARRRGGSAAPALDVFEVEPLPDGPLRRLEQVVLTPHVAGISAASLQAMAARASENIIAVLRGRDPGAGLRAQPRGPARAALSAGMRPV